MSRMNQNPGQLPFDDIRALVDELPGFDATAANGFAAQGRQPTDSIAEIGRWMAGCRQMPDQTSGDR